MVHRHGPIAQTPYPYTYRRHSTSLSDNIPASLQNHQEILPSHSTTMQAEHLALYRALQLAS